MTSRVKKPIEKVNITDGKDFNASTNHLGQVDLSTADLKDKSVLTFSHTSYYSETYTLAEIEKMNFKVPVYIRTIQLEEFVISVSKTKESTREISNKVDIITMKDIAQLNPQTSADALEATGNVYIQKSQMGGGSPIIRGFEANKVLIVVDGVRMNNAIYRGGHLQNVITLDNNMLDRMEVVFGPGSLIYGSDALGGVMHFYTRDPQLTLEDEKMHIGGNAMARYSSANFEKTFHTDLDISGSQFGSLTSFTITDFDDLRTGGNRSPFHGDWGLTPWTTERINGKDTMIGNPDTLVAKYSGYHQYDLMQKLKWKINPNVHVVGNFQFSTSSEIPRYDRLRETEVVEIDSGVFIDQAVNAKWSYGPQTRLLGSLAINLMKSNVAFDDATFTMAYQKIYEERISRDFGSDSEKQRQEEVDVVTVNMDFRKRLSERNKILYGVEVTYNYVTSTAQRMDIITGETSALSTRYPDGGSSMQSYAAYAKNSINITEGLIFSQGIRYSKIILNSKFESTEFFDFNFDEINMNNGALSFSFDFIYNKNDWHANLMFSSGFRAPNVDDVGKIFDPNPGEVVIPNENLEPEFAYNFEAGLSKSFAENINIGVVGFYTIAKNLIERDVFRFEGQDSLVYDNMLSQVLANQNRGKSIIAGITAYIDAELTQGLALHSTVTFTHGQETQKEVPLSHIPPVYGQTKLSYRYKKFFAAFFVKYQGWKKLRRYSPSSVDNLNEALPEGTPAWFTLNIRSGYQFNEHISLQFGVDNMLDHHYRPFGSGISAPGVNFIVALRAGF